MERPVKEIKNDKIQIIELGYRVWGFMTLFSLHFLYLKIFIIRKKPARCQKV